MAITPGPLQLKAFEQSMRVLLAGHGIPDETVTALAADLAAILVDAAARAHEEPNPYPSEALEWNMRVWLAWRDVPPHLVNALAATFTETVDDTRNRVLEIQRIALEAQQRPGPGVH